MSPSSDTATLTTRKGSIRPICLFTVLMLCFLYVSLFQPRPVFFSPFSLLCLSSLLAHFSHHSQHSVCSLAFLLHRVNFQIPPWRGASRQGAASKRNKAKQSDRRYKAVQSSLVAFQSDPTPHFALPSHANLSSWLRRRCWVCVGCGRAKKRPHSIRPQAHSLPFSPWPFQTGALDGQSRQQVAPNRRM